MTEARKALTWSRAGLLVSRTLSAERIVSFCRYAGGRFLHDDCLRQAAGLSYVSLLAIVPLLAIGLAVLAAFPAFDAVRLDLQAMVFENFLPSTSAQVNEYIRNFLDNASRASGPGVLALAVTALLLLNNINEAFNAIWRVPAARPLALRFLVFWALLTLGPLLVGTSLSITSYTFAMVRLSEIETYTGWILPFSRLIAIGLASLGLALMFFVVPNRPVHFAHALAGGVVASVLFEILKVLFGLYLAHFPSYQAIYGALSTIPIFLVWMYLSWSVVLLGAEVTASLPEWRAARARGRQAATPGDQLALALGILTRLRKASHRGGSVEERRLTRGLPATPAEIDVTLGRLRDGGLVERTPGGRWVLARDLSRTRLRELVALLNLELDPGDGWPVAAERTVQALASASTDRLSLSLEQLLGESEEEVEEG